MVLLQRLVNKKQNHATPISQHTMVLKVAQATDYVNVDLKENSEDWNTRDLNTWHEPDILITVYKYLVMIQCSEMKNYDLNTKLLNPEFRCSLKTTLCDDQAT